MSTQIQRQILRVLKEEAAASGFKEADEAGALRLHHLAARFLLSFLIASIGYGILYPLIKMYAAGVSDENLVLKSAVPKGDLPPTDVVVPRAIWVEYKTFQIIYKFTKFFVKQ